jgi:hypothetical protein
MSHGPLSLVVRHIGRVNMDKDLKDRIYAIASSVRKWAEDRDQRREYPSMDLNGLCAVASGKLFLELRKVGIKSEIHLSNDCFGSHVFVVVDKHIVDVTATQFSTVYDPVVLLDLDEVEGDQTFWESDYVFTSIRQLRAAQIEWGWPKEQTALRSYSK